jgi:hypothetical protein
MIDLALADRVAKKQKHRGLDADDIRQIALLVMHERGRDFDASRGTYAAFVDRWTRHTCKVAAGVRRTHRRGVRHVDVYEYDPAGPGASPLDVAVFKSAMRRTGDVGHRLFAGASVPEATRAPSKTEGSRRFARMLQEAGA